MVACATFPYKWYVLDFENGKMLGPAEEQDLPLSHCARVAGGGVTAGYTCVVMDISEFENFRKDYDDKVERLKACEEK